MKKYSSLGLLILVTALLLCYFNNEQSTEQTANYEELCFSPPDMEVPVKAEIYAAKEIPKSAYVIARPKLNIKAVKLRITASSSGGLSRTSVLDNNNNDLNDTSCKEPEKDYTEIGYSLWNRTTRTKTS